MKFKLAIVVLGIIWLISQIYFRVLDNDYERRMLQLQEMPAK